MPCLIALTTDSGTATQTSIYARISTPSNPWADGIDPVYQTVVFIHPIWVDGFFFYPQLEDLELSSRFNLVALDTRGHGQSTSTSLDPSYTAWTAADDIHSALSALNLPDLPHIIAASTGTLAATRYASRYECASLTCIGLATPEELESNIAGFNDVCEAHLHAVLTNDHEALQDLSRASLTFGVDGREIEPIRELCEGYAAEVTEAGWCEGNMEMYVGYTYDPIIKRKAMTEKEIGKITCPVLLLHGEEDTVYPPTTSSTFLASLSRASRVLIDLIPLSPHWCSLSSPNLINPLLLSFLTTLSLPPPEAEYLSPLPTPNSPSPDSMSRRQGIARKPSTPRELEFFISSRLPTVEEGVVTVGDMEQLYLRGLQGKEGKRGSGEGDWGRAGRGEGRRASVVEVGVEVLVVDQEGREM